MSKFLGVVPAKCQSAVTSCQNRVYLFGSVFSFLAPILLRVADFSSLFSLLTSALVSLTLFFRVADLKTAELCAFSVFKNKSTSCNETRGC